MRRFLAFTLRLVSAAAFLGSVSAVDAAVVWDESTDGDLSTVIDLATPGTDLGTLGPGHSDIVGTLDGASRITVGPDEFDVVEFTATAAWSLDIVSLSLDLPAFRLDVGVWEGPSPWTPIGSGATPAASPLVFGPEAAGTYRLAFFPQFNEGTLSYTARINVIPLPPALVLLGAGLLGLLGVGYSERRIRLPFRST